MANIAPESPKVNRGKEFREILARLTAFYKAPTIALIRHLRTHYPKSYTYEKLAEIIGMSHQAVRQEYGDKENHVS